MTNHIDDVLIRREDAVRVAELINDSIRDQGKFAAAIRLIPPHPQAFDFEGIDCPICAYPIDSDGLCVIDAAHTARQAGLAPWESTDRRSFEVGTNHVLGLAQEKGG